MGERFETKEAITCANTGITATHVAPGGIKVHALSANRPKTAIASTKSKGRPDIGPDRSWNHDCDLVLRQLVEEGFSIPETCTILNRSKSSVETRLLYLEEHHPIQFVPKTIEDIIWRNCAGVRFGHL